MRLEEIAVILSGICAFLTILQAYARHERQVENLANKHENLKRDCFVAISILQSKVKDIESFLSNESRKDSVYYVRHDADENAQNYLER